MSDVAYPLATERLWLRPFADDDLEALIVIDGDHGVARYVPWEPRSPDEVRQALERRMTMSSLREPGDALRLAAVLMTSAELVGDVMLRWLPGNDRQGEIGFIVHPDHQGRGYGSEASSAMLRHGFEDMGLHRIVGRCDPRNIASARLMERLGMRREAHLRENEMIKGEWTDELVYAMLNSEWAAGR